VVVGVKMEIKEIGLGDVDWIHLMHAGVECCYENGKIPIGFIKGREFLD
jgi:hypothetical protein